MGKLLFSTIVTCIGYLYEPQVNRRVVFLEGCSSHSRGSQTKLRELSQLHSVQCDVLYFALFLFCGFIYSEISPAINSFSQGHIGVEGLECWGDQGLEYWGWVAGKWGGGGQNFNWLETNRGAFYRPPPPA